jgi:hypothetical protein
MKHRLSILLAAVLAIGGSLFFTADTFAGPVITLEKIFNEFESAVSLTRDLNHASNEDLNAFVIEAQAGPVELAFLPIEPAPSRVEKASCRVPHVTTASGYLRHAWTDPSHAKRNAPQRQNIIFGSYILGLKLRTC